MLDDLLAILVEVGLMKADKEQKKRGSSKEFLPPSIKILLVLLLLAAVVGILIGWNAVTKVDKTDKEMKEISFAIQ